MVVNRTVARNDENSVSSINVRRGTWHAFILNTESSPSLATNLITIIYPLLPSYILFSNQIICFVFSIFKLQARYKRFMPKNKIHRISKLTTN